MTISCQEEDNPKTIPFGKVWFLSTEILVEARLRPGYPQGFIGAGLEKLGGGGCGFAEVADIAFKDDLASFGSPFGTDFYDPVGFP